MIFTYSWRGAGIIVLLIAPAVLAVGLICSVNFIGKEFTKVHFRDLVIGGVVVAGFLCYFLGRWLNRERVVREAGGEVEELEPIVGDSHQLWGIAVQHWLWVHLGLAGVLAFLW